MVFVSPWWVRAHWGRAFEIGRLEPEGFAGVVVEGGTQGVVAMRARAVAGCPELLEGLVPDGPRCRPTGPVQRRVGSRSTFSGRPVRS